MPESEHRRPNPEQLLQQVEAAERRHSRGKLKVFLGYASGVGKSFRMLDEGRRRKMRGRDVVGGATQPSASPEVEELLRGFEIIPPRTDLGAPAIDVPAVVRRHPEICLIDGLAYRNPPGSKNAQRWQDVEDILASGISVITSINLQYVQERQAQVEAIRGKAVKESVPESFLRTADEIEVVDAPASQLERQLSELRELALLLAADVVEQDIAPSYGTHERILVCVTPRSNAALMIHRARRQADRFHGDLCVVYVQQDGLAPADQQVLDQNLSRAREAQAQVQVLHGEDPIGAILRFAAQQGITQIFVGHSQQTGWRSHFRANPVERLILEADGMDVRIFPQSPTP